MRNNCLPPYRSLLPAQLTLLAALLVAVPGHAAPTSATTAPLPAARRINHALNRLAYGPRPGDAARIEQMGLERWVDAQLRPDTIDDSAVEARLNGLTLLKLTPSQLALAYAADTADFVKNARKQQKAAKQDAATKQDTAAAPAKMKPQQARLMEMIKESGFAPRASVQAVGELQVAKIIRATESNRQLQEVMVDFWSNHFNLDAKKGPVRTLLIANERDVIRPNVFGKFRTLLGATAKSPAMLFYLDNVRSSVEMPVPAGRQQPVANAPKKRGGINENYARELMELHTLGVDGGYTQADVQEVARCLTGWSIERRTGEFIYRPFQHDNGEKRVLGTVIPAGGGVKDGEMVLDILAAHPSTARHIARKMCRRLVADEPPDALVERAAAVFTRTGGDLREVTRAIVTSSEFYSSAAYRTKIKSPFEYAVSAVRALGGRVEAPDPARQADRLRLVNDGAVAMDKGRGGRKQAKKSMAQQIGAMGQPLYSYQAPTGYPEDSRQWVSTGALVARLNFALALTGNEVAQVTVAPRTLLGNATGDDHEAVLTQLGNVLLGGDLTASTRTTLLKEMPAGTPADIGKTVALLLGSPEFQRH